MKAILWVVAGLCAASLLGVALAGNETLGLFVGFLCSVLLLVLLGIKLIHAMMADFSEDEIAAVQHVVMQSRR